MLPASRREKGFALLPLILSVMVIGALVGVGLTLVKERVKRAKLQESRSRLSAAVEALGRHALENGRLPQWGDNAVDSQIDEFCEVVKHTEDAWHQPLVYIYDNNLTTTAGGGVCGRQTTALNDGTTSDIAFVVLSGGQDHAVDSNPGSSGGAAGTLGLSADDILRTVSLEQLRNRAGCFAQIPGRFELLNNELPDACNNQPYAAAIYAQGGVPAGTSPFYTWTTPTLPAWMTAAPEDGHLGLTGTPTALGNAVVEAAATDGDGSSVARRFVMTVIDCGSGPSPVSAWNFDEGAGTTAHDAAGGNDGMLNGDTTWSGDTPNAGGSALQFDGSGDYVRIADDAALRLTAELTLAAWVKETQSHQYAKVISRRSGFYFYFLGVDGGRPYGGIGDGGDYTVTGKSLLMSLDRWNHLAFAYKDADDRMYLHFAGTERPSSVSQNLPPRANVDVSIGADSQGSGNYFSGIIDDVAIYAGALSAAELRTLYADPSHPDRVASYEFAGSAIDTSGNGHDAAINGAVFVADRNGNADSALRFSGGDALIIPDHPDLRLQELTLTAWIKETARRSFAKIVSRRQGSYFYFLGVDNGRPYGGIGNGSNYTVTRKSIDMPLDQWHFVALVFDTSANRMHIYYDGILDETAITVSLPDTADVDVVIGADAEGTGNFFEGLIDEPAIYDTALTAEAIRSTY